MTPTREQTESFVMEKQREEFRMLRVTRAIQKALQYSREHADQPNPFSILQVGQP